MLELPGTCIEIHEKDPAMEGDEEDDQEKQSEIYIENKTS